ncbi:bacteriophage holin [Candidatus Protochlamydia phocaeensis]|uniref:bacteriophage holin n=1 Tax=Candidatus Protochlamydia phocaeensis TaxID=1414722 RepID=UPI000837C31B|nr:bacteriophage holin [Candidatus Protochlamydia phocaeensis]
MLYPVRLGIAGGIVWGVSLFLFTILSLYSGYAEQFLNLMANIYPGYEISWPGAFIGLLYGFADVFIGLALIAWLYNKMKIHV